jgi:hypothetical protein
MLLNNLAWKLEHIKKYNIERKFRDQSHHIPSKVLSVSFLRLPTNDLQNTEKELVYSHKCGS